MTKTLAATRPLVRTATHHGLRLAGMAGAVAAALVLAACDQKKPAAAAPGGGPGGPGKPQVSVMVLHPRSVVVTAEMPGRTVASLVAEVRPQVSGIIKSRPYKEGGDVKAGDVLYEIDPATYQAAFDSANANRQKAEAAVPNAQAKVERYQGLLKQNAVSKQELDDAIASLAQAKADVAAAEAAVETARINLAYTKVTAPISGRIGASAYTVGALVTADQTTALTTIRALDPINVDVTQSSTNLLKFREALKEGRMKITGGQVNVKLKLETGATYGATGRMEFAEANVDQTTGTFALRAVFPNPDHLLMPGMYVRATVEEGIAENSFLIPQRAVARTPQGQPTARFVTAEGKLEDRVLSVQRAVGNTWLIDKGVADGDRVIVEGGMMARAGMEVGTREVTVDDATGEIRPVNQGQIEGGTVVANGDAKPGESPSKTGQN